MNATAELVEPVTTDSDDEDLTHVVCCNPDVALCGVSVAGDSWVEVGDTTTCRLCALAEDLPCGNPDCPDREVAGL